MPITRTFDIDPGDTIDLRLLPWSPVSYSSGMPSITGGGATYTLTLTEGDPTTLLTPADNGQGGTDQGGMDQGGMELTAAFAAASAATSTSSHWTNTAGGDWTEAANWSDGVPTSSLDAVLGLNSYYYYTVTLTGAGEARSLTISPYYAALNIYTSSGSSPASLAITDNLSNGGTLLVDASGPGGSTVTIGGVLTNTYSLTIGNSSLSAAATVSADALVNTGSIYLYGGSGANTGQATLDINSAAPMVLTGYFRLSGHALLQFGSGSIEVIDDNATLWLSGPDAFVANAASPGSNSALAGLTSNAGQLQLDSGVDLAITGDFSNTGSLFIDYYTAGGSLLSVAGTLTNTGGIYIGGSVQTASVTVSVGALVNTGYIQIYGGTDTNATEAVLEVAAAAPSAWLGYLYLYGHARVQFGGSSSIESIASYGYIQLDGDSLIANAADPNSNSALAALATNDGTLWLYNGTTLHLQGDFTNNGTVYVDYNAVDGSSLTIDGAFTNTYILSIGYTYGSLGTTVSAAELFNTGTIYLYGGSDTATNQTVLDITGAAPSVLAGYLYLHGNSRISFGGSTGINTIASSGAVLLEGVGAHIANATDLNSNSALTALTINDGLLELENGASLPIQGDLTNNGYIYVDYSYYDGGSSLTIGGRLTNVGYLRIGNGYAGAATTVTAADLVNLGTVDLYGSSDSYSTYQVTLDISAGTAPTVLTGRFNLYGNAQVNFAGGQITQIGGGGQIILDNVNSLITNADDRASNSALSGLTSNAGLIDLRSGASLHLACDFTNFGTFYLGYSYSTGGGSLIVDGMLANTGYFVVGSTYQTAATTVTAGGFSNTGQLYLYGASGTGAPQTVLQVTAGAAPAVLTGYYYLSGNASIEFASGGIESIAYGAQLHLNGGAAFISNQSGPGSNSALNGLQSNAGILDFGNAVVHLLGDFANFGTLYVDGYNYYTAGGSLTIDGTLTNTGYITIGNYYISASTTVSVADMFNDGTIQIFGGTGGNTFQATLNVSGLAIDYGTIYLYENAVLTAGSLTIANGGIIYVYSGGTVTGVSIGAGGREVVSSGGTATAPIVAGGTLELAGGTVIGGGITFAGVGGTLQIDNTTMPTNTISGSDEDDRIDLRAVTFDSAGSATYDADSDTLTVAAGGVTYTLILDGILAGAQFGVANDGFGGTLVYQLAFAATTVWSDATGGDWDAPSNWSAGVPGPDTAATIGVAGNYTVTLTTSGAAGDLTIDHSGAVLQITTSAGEFGPASLAVQGDFTNSGVLYVDVLSNQGGTTLTVGGTLTNRYYVQIGNSALLAPTNVTAGALVNSGTFYLNGGGGGGATLSVAGDVLNAASLYVDPFSNAGGGTLTVGGTLTNSSYLQIGTTNLTGPSTVSATALANTGTIRLYGGTGTNTNQAILDIAAMAPDVWTGQLYISGHASVEFQGGSIGSIAGGAYIVLNGSDAFVANGGAPGSNSALTGLASNFGTLQFDSAVTVGITGDFVNNGGFYIDHGGAGGSIATIAGTLTNVNSLILGNNLAQPTILSAGALVNTGWIYLYGGTTSAQTTLDIGSAAPPVLTGYYYLSGDAAIEFAAGTIESIANGASIVLNGGASIDIAGSPGTNSALVGLRENAGSLDLRYGAVVATAGDFLNNGSVFVDYYGGTGGWLSIGGTLTNTGYIYIGNASTSGSTVTAAGLADTGYIYLYGGTGSSTNAATLNITGQAAPSLLTGNLYLSGNALVAFAGSDSVLGIAEGASVVLNGGTARIANATDLGSNSALAGLAHNAGTLELDNGAALHIAGDFTNDGAVLVDYYYYYGGVSNLAIDGTLNNAGTFYIGSIYNTAVAVTAVTAAELANTGTIYLNGGIDTNLYQATLNITSGTAPAILSGVLNLYGRTLLQFAGNDSIVSIAGDGSIVLNGGSAFIANASDPNSNSALTRLQSNAGSLNLTSGATISTAGDFSNSGYVYVDGYYYYSGGSSFTIGGTLHNTGYIYLGNYYQTVAGTTLRAAYLDNSGSIYISGGAAGSIQSVLEITSGTAPSVLSGYFNLYGNTLVAFAGSDSISSIGATGGVVLNGGMAFIANAGDLNSNSALSGLQSNAGVLELEQGAVLNLPGNFTNTGYLYVDTYYYSGGSTLTIGGLFTNTGSVTFGGGYQTNPTMVSVGSLANGGTIYVYGSYYSTGLVTFSVTGSGTDSGTIYLYQNAVLAAAGGLTVVDGGRLYVSSGATASGAVVGSGGLEYVYSGGTVANGTISGGTLELAGGTVTAGTIDFLGSGGTLQIDTTTMPTNTIVNFRGYQTIDLRAVSGGSAGSAGIDASNLLTVTENGISYTLQLDPNRNYTGVSVILADDGSGGTLVTLDIPAIFVSSGETLLITSGQYEDSINVLNGGTLIVYAGGTVIGTIDQGIEILSGGVDIWGLVESGGALFVSAGGLASSTIVGMAGQLQVLWGGTASDVTVGSGGLAVVQSGGLTDDSTIAGGILELDPGAVASGAISFVVGGGVLQIDDAEMPTNTISGFTAGTFIDITTLPFGPGTSATLDGTTLTVTDGVTVEVLTVIVPVSAGFTVDLVTSDDGQGGTLVGVQYTSSSSNVVSSGETRTISAGETSAGLTVLFGGTLLVLAGGTASGTVDSGSEILSGGTDIFGTVESAGVLVVSSGGLASGTVVHSGGEVVVSAGGSTASVTLLGVGPVVSGAVAAQQTVSSGGAVSATTVSSGGRLRLLSGGLASTTTVLEGGIEVISAGGLAIGTALLGNSPVSSGSIAAQQTVSSGGTASATGVFSGGRLSVLDAGAASGAVVLNGGVAVVSAGGTAFVTTISSGGRQVLSAGGTATGTTVSAGGLEVLSGGTEVGGTVAAGGTLDVSAGSTVSSTVFGTQSVFGGSISATAVFAGGVLNVSVAGVASGTTILGGIEVVFAGGMTFGTTVSAGSEIVSSGGVASGTLVLAGGVAVISAGGTASGTTVSTGGSEILSGGIEIGGIVESGGQLVVSVGGVASGTALHSGGLAVVSTGGTASSTTVSAGGSEILSGGTEIGGTVAAGGTLDVLAGGATVSTTIFGTQSVFSGTASATAIFAGGVLNVSDLGIAIGTTIVGGTEIVSAGGITLGTTVSAGSMVVSSSGVASGAIVLAGGIAIVSAGGTASGTTVSSGGSEVLSGGTEFGGTVAAGGTLVVSAGSTESSTVFGTQSVFGGSVSATAVFAGGVLNVSVAGVANGTTVLGGTEIVFAGGMTFGTTVSAGSEVVSSGGVASGTVVLNGAVAILSAGGTASGMIVSDGGQAILSGGTDIGGTVESGGVLVISAGGIASGTLVRGGGNATVSTGGLASGTVLQSGGVEIVLAGGTAIGTIVSAGGTGILSGGTDIGGTIAGGGVLNVSAGGLASNTVVSGTLDVFAGGATQSSSVFGTQSVVGGSVSASAVFAGGVLNVSAGGIADGTTLLGGIEVVFADGTANFTTILAGGIEVVSSGGAAIGTTISGSGLAIVLVGGTASGTTISGGGSEVLSGGVEIGGTVASGGVLIVSAGGFVSGGLVLSGGLTVVSAGGSTASVTLLGVGPVSSGLEAAQETVSAGGAASATTVSSGGRLLLLSGGLASATTVLNGGIEVISAGGLAIGTALLGNSPVSSGSIAAQQTVSSGGTASATGVFSGGRLLVLDAGAASGAVVFEGGVAVVSAGGAAFATTISSGGLQVLSAGGTASGTIVSGGGSEVLSGGTEFGGTVAAGGTLVVSAGSTESSTVFGTQSVFGGSVSATAIFAGGVLNVSVAGVANGTTVLGGIEIVFAGGMTFGTTVSAGSEIVSSGGVASGTVVLDGAVAVVSAGGTVIDATISGATLELAAGAFASGTISLAGVDDLLQIGGFTTPGAVIAGFDTDDSIDLRDLAFSGGSATLGADNVLTVHQGGSTFQLQLDPGQNFAGLSFATLADGFGGTLVIVFDSNTVGPGQTLVLTAGQVVSGITVLSGGTLVVGSGAIVSGALIDAGGVEIVNAGGLDVDATVASGGFQDIFGTASGTLIIAGGSQTVEVGGSTQGTVLDDIAIQDVFGFAGGTVISATDIQIVEAGGIASGTVISAGGLAVVFAGGLTIDTTIDSGGTLELESGALVDGFVDFAGVGGLLQIEGSSLPDGFTITGFERGDRIDLRGLSSVSSFTFENGTLTISGSFVDTLQFSGLASGTAFGLVSDGSGGMFLTEVPVAPSGLALSPESDSGVAGDNVTNDTTPTITGTGEAGDAVSLFDGGVFVGSGTVAGNGIWAITTGLLGDGVHNLVAMQTDSFGGFSAPSQALLLSIDTVAPVTPLVSATFAWNAGPTPIGIAAPSEAFTITVTELPSNGTVTFAGGATAVSLGSQLTIGELTGLEFAPASNQIGSTDSFAYRVTDLAGNETTGTATLGVVPAASASLFDFFFTYNSGGDYYFGVVADDGTFGYQVGQTIPFGLGQYVIFNDQGLTEQAAGTVSVTYYAHAGPGQASYLPVNTASGIPSGTQGLGSESDAVLGIDGQLYPFSGASAATFATTNLFGFVFTYADGRAYYAGTVADDGSLDEPSRIVTDGAGNVLGTYSIFNQGLTTRAPGTVLIDRLVIGDASFVPIHTGPGGVDGTAGLGSEVGSVVIFANTVSFSNRVEPLNIPTPVPLVDAAYYDAIYPDVAQSGQDPSYHYHTFGWLEGRNPSAFFSTTEYLNANPDVKAAGLDPLTHYDQNGWKEGRDPALNFDDEYYLAHAPDVKAAGIDPLLHYLQYGRAEGRAIAPAIGSNTLTSNGFDRQFYLMKNADIAAAGIDPFEHFSTLGWQEGRDPNAYFSTSGYLASQPDVRAAGVNPLVHYDQSGWREGRDPSANFDTQFYLIHSPDVAAAGIDPLTHYLKHGVSEARLILPAVGPAGQITDTDFDPKYYLLAYPDIAARGVDPFTDFTTIGWQDGRDPNGLFDTDFYLSHNPDVAAAGMDPLSHYSQFGWKEGRDPSALFDTSRYLVANPDVAAAQIDPLHHFLVNGLYEGRLL